MKKLALTTLLLVIFGSAFAADCDHDDCDGITPCDDCTCDETVDECSGDCCDCEAEECDEECTCECEDCDHTIVALQEEEPCGTSSGCHGCPGE